MTDPSIRQWAVTQVMSKQGLDPVTEATADEIIRAAAVLEGYVAGATLPTAATSFAPSPALSRSASPQSPAGFWRYLLLWCRPSKGSVVGVNDRSVGEDVGAVKVSTSGTFSSRPKFVFEAGR